MGTRLRLSTSMTLPPPASSYQQLVTSPYQPGDTASGTCADEASRQELVEGIEARDRLRAELEPLTERLALSARVEISA